MAWVDLSGDDNKWYSWLACRYECDWSYGADADEVEKKMLKAFGDLQIADAATIVTWNGRTFDLPVINLRSFLHGVPCPWYYQERDVRYRYTEACHCDVMDVLSDFGACRPMKLDDTAHMVGLPGKVGEVHGSKISEIFEAHRDSTPEELAIVQEAVGAYCLHDALQTAVIFARTRMHKGILSEEYYRTVVEPSFANPLTVAAGLAQASGKLKAAV